MSRAKAVHPHEPGTTTPASPPLPSSFIQPFVPARDYELSKAFYKALGFQVRFEGSEVTGFNHPSGAFLLQNYFVEAWAHNFMLSWGVDDLEDWFAEVSALDLPTRFGVKAPTPPKLQPWGLTIAYLFDPSGVLWHVSQKPKA